ncbi:MAG: hypothetical protein JSV04_11635 [Candidatus Heimdallarchaeota archaeon]|nr:MAG: hypothetical protein JSV04_11635 [Candidatus Heimdallarchaeota archaeon]
MTQCHKCKKTIDGEVFKRPIFIPPAIFIPLTYCGECFHLEKQREENLCPLLIFVLVIVLIPLLVLLLI